MPEPVIVATARSPIGRAFKGSMVDTRADDLAVQIVRAALAKVPQIDPHRIDDHLVGCALPGGEQGFNIGRVVSVMLGWDDVPGTTVNRYCASSLQTTRMAAHAIRVGEADIMLSTGIEVVSRQPPRVPDDPMARHPAFLERIVTEQRPWTDPRSRGELPDVYISMGATAENVASIHGITRDEMDEYAYRSQMLAEQARQDGFWDLDITPVTLADGTVLARDEGPRPTTTREGLATLQPVFSADGLITAGNACGLNDGVASVVVMSDRLADELGIRPLARIVSTAVSALSPEIMGLGPVEATRKAVASAGLSIDDIDQIEINEAFAAQVIPSYRELGIPLEKVNVNGGAIALGHPYGMTGARITSTLLNSLERRGERYGVETMCVAGGMGMAMVVERLT